MISPPFLQKGDTIAIVATARSITSEELQPVTGRLMQEGFQVMYAPDLFKVHHQYAGTDDQRAADLQWAVDQKEIKAILVARGGYGTMRIIDQVNFSALISDPKWVIGYSDVTALHARLRGLGLESLHATMPISFGKDEESVNLLLQTLKGENLSYKVTHHLKEPFVHTGMAGGTLVGGNLSLVYALQGSVDDLNTNNCILFLEDIDEYLYHIDRMFLSLKRAGKFDRIKGFIAGGFTDMKDNTIPFGQTAEEIISTYIPTNIPLFMGFPAGHTLSNLPLIFGRTVHMEVSPTAFKLRF